MKIRSTITELSSSKDFFYYNSFYKCRDDIYIFIYVISIVDDLLVYNTLEITPPLARYIHNKFVRTKAFLIEHYAFHKNK